MITTTEIIDQKILVVANWIVSIWNESGLDLQKNSLILKGLKKDGFLSFYLRSINTLINLVESSACVKTE
ncbi:hypothetical protein DLK05_10335 [Ancylomarina longa]|uniref:Uncharacterized protein n=1 Tax=Ancylomarina longa TaxID=2487017 RepID=A0A434AUL2_9BACT|nr:hypothetical protein DLK05_10335 [Ancylomarina longa]